MQLSTDDSIIDTVGEQLDSEIASLHEQSMLLPKTTMNQADPHLQLLH